MRCRIQIMMNNIKYLHLGDEGFNRIKQQNYLFLRAILVFTPLLLCNIYKRVHHLSLALRSKTFIFFNVSRYLAYIILTLHNFEMKYSSKIKL